MTALKVDTRGFHPKKVLRKSEKEAQSSPAPSAPKPSASEVLSKDLSRADAAPRSQYAASSDNVYRQKQQQDILKGRIPLFVPTSLLSDEIGTDRSNDWESDDAFEQLVQSIELVGQKEPIRVRAKDPEWVPTHRGDLKEIPDDEDQHFYIQSGRRRAAACKRLGINVIAFLSTDDDAVERLRENTQRSDLCAFDMCRSIGSVASLFKSREPDITNAEISRRLNVSRPLVSISLDVLRLEDRIAREENVTQLSQQDLRRLIPLYNNSMSASDGPSTSDTLDDIEIGIAENPGVSADTPSQEARNVASSPPALKTRSPRQTASRATGYKATAGRYSVEYKPMASGLTVSIRRNTVSSTKLEQIAHAIEAILKED